LGTYAVADEHFRALATELDPSARLPEPWRRYRGRRPSGSLPPGGPGTWQLETALTAPGGYVLRLRARDRSIDSGSGTGWEAVPKSIGFSLEV